MGQRRKFTPEYRRDAAGQLIDTGATIASVARDLSLGEQLVGRWVKAERERREAESRGELSPADLAAENAALRRRVRQLEGEPVTQGWSKTSKSRHFRGYYLSNPRCKAPIKTA